MSKLSSHRYSEATLQAYAASALQRLIDAGAPIRFAGDQNGSYRSPAARGLAKAGGMTAGEPDLRIYLTGERIRHIELKAKGGALSKAQRERHAELASLGHKVYTVKATTPLSVVTAVVTLVYGWLADEGWRTPEGQLKKIIETGLNKTATGKAETQCKTKTIRLAA